jgi:MYXO-CTERM domain-containing protein
MRHWVNALVFLGFIVPAAVPLLASDLNFTINPNSNPGTGNATNLTPDADPPCMPPNCVLFIGTLTDTDDDADPTYPDMIFPFPSISVEFSSNPASGMLSLDNTFYDSVDYFPGVLSGDPNYATDNSGNPPDTYTGPLFGIDIAPGTTLGTYTGTITIDVAGGLDDPDYNGFIVMEPITVDVVAPEPSAGSLALAGLAAFWAWRGVRRKWPFSEAPSRRHS